MTKRSHIIDKAKVAGAKYGVVYTCRCGWVDVGHGTASSSRPFIGADKLWAQLSMESGTKSPNGMWHKVTYRQDMGTFIEGHFVNGGDVTREYAVRLGLSTAEKESVALSIFTEVSVSFEELQGNWIYFLSDSSFSGEDLVSNLIGFYRVVRPGTDYIAACGPVSKAASEKVWDTYGAPGEAANKNRTFTPNLFPCSECKGGVGQPVCAALPAMLTTISPAPLGPMYRLWNPADPVQATAPAPAPTPPPATAPAAPAKPAATMVTVRRGDTLSGLAASNYGDWRYWPLLWQANRSVVGTNPNRLKRGAVLTVPPLADFTAQQKADAVRAAPSWTIYPH
jgi:hypothetical protein